MSATEPGTPQVALLEDPAGLTSGHWLRRAARLLYTHNPFYLLSVAFVLQSTRLWLNTRSWPYDPWPLMDIIGGYILVVAVVGFLVIRLGNAWDDARSIFLILLLLFVELSLTFDPVLVAQPRLGILLLVTGWLLAVGVSEGLLWGLRIRLPRLFRAPYHLVLALLFLYPPVIVSGFPSATDSAIWRIWAFSPLASFAMLTLIPAIRRGPEYVRNNGTPWNWPWFPWGLFGFLGLCLASRAYALTLSFDSVLMQGLPEAMRLDSAFLPFFVAPLVLAAGTLLLEAGLVARSPRIQRFALMAPLLVWLLSWSFEPTSAPAADFLRRFTEQLGGPLWQATWAGVFFCSYAWLRGVQGAAWGAVASLLLLSVTGPRTIDLATMHSQGWPLWIIALALGVAGARRGRSQELFLSGAALLLAARFDWLGHAHWLYRDALPLQGLCIWAAVLGAWFNDAWARRLRAIGVAGLVLGGMLAIVGPGPLPSDLPWWARVIYLASDVLGILSCAYVFRNRSYFFAGVGVLIVSLGRIVHLGTVELQHAARWDGASFFVAGLVWLGVAVVISAFKAGLGSHVARLVPQRIRGSPENEPPSGR